MDTHTNWFKVYFIDVLPCITISLYLLAIVYNIAFYSVFDINIIPYITLSEILLSILEPLIYCLFFLLLFLYFFLFYLDSLLPGLLEASSRRKRPRKLLRFMVKIKKNKFVKIIVGHLKQTLELRKNRSELYFHLRNFAFLIIALTITLEIFEMHQFNEDSDFGLTKAAYGLMLPFLEVVILSGMIPFVCPKIFSYIINYFKKYKTIDKVAVLVFFYIYSFFVFFESGIDCGIHYKNKSSISFEIKTVDGSIYNDSSYVYIGKVNNKIFIQDRQSGTNCILHDNSAAYIKMKDLNYNKSLLFKLMNKKKE